MAQILDSYGPPPAGFASEWTCPSARSAASSRVVTTIASGNFGSGVPTSPAALTNSGPSALALPWTASRTGPLRMPAGRSVAATSVGSISVRSRVSPVGTGRRYPLVQQPHRVECLADAFGQRRGLPAELALRLRGIRLGLPEEVDELTARQQRGTADQSGDALADRGDRARDWDRHHWGHASAARDVLDGLGDLTEAGVAVGEDVALAVGSLFRCQEVPVGDALHEGVASAPGRHGREPLADDRLEETVLERRGWRGGRAIDAGRIEDHHLHPIPFREHQLLGVLLGALVRGPLRIVGKLRLVEFLAGVGVKHVMGG